MRFAPVHDHDFSPAPLLLPWDIIIFRIFDAEYPGTYYPNLTLIPTFISVVPHARRGFSGSPFNGVLLVLVYYLEAYL